MFEVEDLVNEPEEMDDCLPPFKRVVYDTDSDSDDEEDDPPPALLKIFNRFPPSPLATVEAIQFHQVVEAAQDEITGANSNHWHYQLALVSKPWLVSHLQHLQLVPLATLLSKGVNIRSVNHPN